MCGFNIIIVYGVDIMNHAVKDIHTAKLLQLPLYGMQIIFTLLSLVLMQKMDRKKVIQMGTAMCLSTLLLMSIGLLEYEKYSIQQKILVVGSLFIFMACFRLTLGPVTWVYIFEISDEGVAGKAATIKWTTCCLTVIIFPIIGKAINPGYLFLFLSGWCVVSLIINHMDVVETKNRSKQDIAKDFAGKDN
jgi:SP family arabinose:H+ symporter-like MFS transporter